MSSDGLLPYPKMVGIDWSILSVVESNGQVDIEEPLAEVSLQAISQNGSEQVKLLCNKNQLQDFHWNVKEAYNFLLKLTRNNPN
uniref:COMM domain-containing protein n=1 Tax=Meloidogyne incognita TaxID=6306 RepID=A0A914MUQ8_MELIC